jgi:predicted phosphodiesterase
MFLTRKTGILRFSTVFVLAVAIASSALLGEEGQKTVALKLGPVIGLSGNDFLTISCQTNMPATIRLDIDNQALASEEGEYHSFKVEKLKPGSEYPYTLTGVVGKEKTEKRLGAFKARTPPLHGKLTFCAITDIHASPPWWPKTAEVLAKEKYDFILCCGDAVDTNNKYDQWKCFFNATGELFSSAPLFFVAGNHDRNASLLPKMLPGMEGGDKFWNAKIGPVCVLGIDGAADWSPKGKLYPELEKALSASKEKFLFLMTHYPHWSSGVNNARKTPVLSLLKKYNATAILAGHDHTYERSEPEGGVPVVICGAVKYPLLDKVKNAAKQNPYSKVLSTKSETSIYVVFSVEDDVCTLKAVNLDGKTVDTATFKAREQK